jgi:hypothetical protein
MEVIMIAKQAHSLLTPQDVAERLGVSVTTLATWRCTKRYPLAYVKVGRLVRYRMGDVETFEISRLQGVVANDWYASNDCRPNTNNNLGFCRTWNASAVFSNVNRKGYDPRIGVHYNSWDPAFFLLPHYSKP